MTEAVPYPISAAMIIALVAVLLGLAPDMANPDVILVVVPPSNWYFVGLNSAVALVAAALFLAAAMQATNLHKRLALFMLFQSWC